MRTYPSDLLATPSTRGERNNNPTNMDAGKPPIPWQGLAGPNTDYGEDRFAVFSTPQFGIRAAVINMRTHAARLPHMTLRQLIGIWAPPSENNTAAYLANVSGLTRVKPDAVIDLHDRAFVHALVVSVITHENGRCIYRDHHIDQALTLAGDFRDATSSIAA